MKEDIIKEQACPKCGSTEKFWNNIKERYDCLQCGKKWIMIQRTGTRKGRLKNWWDNSILNLALKTIGAIRKL